MHEQQEIKGSFYWEGTMSTIIENIALALAFIIGAGGLAAGMAMMGIWRMKDDEEI